MPNLELTAINCRLHALEDIFVSMFPDKKRELTDLFMENFKEAIPKELKFLEGLSEND